MVPLVLALTLVSRLERREDFKAIQDGILGLLLRKESDI